MTTTYEDEFDYSRNLTATAAAEYKDLVKDYVSAMMNIFDDDGGLDKSNLSAAKKIASGYYRSYRLSQAAKFAAWAEALVAVFVKDGASECTNLNYVQPTEQSPDDVRIV